MFKNRYFATEGNVQQTTKYNPILMRAHIPTMPSLLIIGVFNDAFCAAHFMESDNGHAQRSARSLAENGGSLF